MKFLFEFVSCCGSPRKQGERIQAAAPPEGEEEGRRWTRRRRRKRRRGAAADWKPSLCAISEDMVVVTVERVGGGRERRKKAAADSDSDSEQERSASRKRSGGSCARVRDRVFNGDEYDQRRASFQAVIPTFSPTPFMF